ncbi:hypothetical protein BH09MYX1_BH09MYX1_46570 [soil metagenome]
MNRDAFFDFDGRSAESNRCREGSHSVVSLEALIRDTAAARAWQSRGLATARTDGEPDMFLRRLGACDGAVS